MDQTIISPHAANKVAANYQVTTFEDFRQRIINTSDQDIAYADGTPIKLEPGGKYSFISLKLGEFLTAEQFYILLGGISKVIGDLSAAGTLPENLLQGVATIMDIETVPVPEGLTDKQVEIELNGNMRLCYNEVEE
jgi:hypothetical protein